MGFNLAKKPSTKISIDVVKKAENGCGCLLYARHKSEGMDGIVSTWNTDEGKRNRSL